MGVEVIFFVAPGFFVTLQELVYLRDNSHEDYYTGIEIVRSGDDSTVPFAFVFAKIHSYMSSSNECDNAPTASLTTDMDIIKFGESENIYRLSLIAKKEVRLYPFTTDEYCYILQDDSWDSDAYDKFVSDGKEFEMRAKRRALEMEKMAAKMKLQAEKNRVRKFQEKFDYFRLDTADPVSHRKIQFENVQVGERLLFSEESLENFSPVSVSVNTIAEQKASQRNLRFYSRRFGFDAKAVDGGYQIVTNDSDSSPHLAVLLEIQKCLEKRTGMQLEQPIMTIGCDNNVQRDVVKFPLKPLLIDDKGNEVKLELLPTYKNMICVIEIPYISQMEGENGVIRTQIVHAALFQ